MLEEAAVFGCERRLDQGIGNFIQRHGIVVKNAALAKLVAVDVEKLDREFAGREFTFIEFQECGERQRVEDNETAGSERDAFGKGLVQKAAPASELEADEKTIAAVPGVFELGPRFGEDGIDFGINSKPVEAVATALFEEPIVQVSNP